MEQIKTKEMEQAMQDAGINNIQKMRQHVESLNVTRTREKTEQALGFLAQQIGQLQCLVGGLVGVAEQSKNIPSDGYPGHQYQHLFDHMSKVHGLTLVQGEMDDIIALCNSIASQHIDKIENILVDCHECLNSILNDERVHFIVREQAKEMVVQINNKVDIAGGENG